MVHLSYIKCPSEWSIHSISVRMSWLVDSLGRSLLSPLEKKKALVKSCLLRELRRSFWISGIRLKGTGEAVWID